MKNGIVKFFNRSKNFGFIEGDDEVEYFVHGSSVEEGQLHDDDAVEFDIEESDRGPRAIDVKVTKKASERKSVAHKEKAHPTGNSNSSEPTLLDVFDD